MRLLPIIAAATIVFLLIKRRFGDAVLVAVVAAGAGLLVTDMLMFIGGGSASTAGGIKVTTLAVLFIAAFAEARGFDDMDAAGRRIPNDVLRVAVSVVLWGATIVAGSTITLLMITGAPLDRVLFEVGHGFSTPRMAGGSRGTQRARAS